MKVKNTRGVQLTLGAAEAQAIYDAALLADGTHREEPAQRIYRNAMRKLQEARFPNQTREDGSRNDGRSV